MKPADQIYLFFLEDQGILFNEPLQKLYHLNTIAAFVWCMLEDNVEEVELRNKIIETFALSIDQADLYFSQAETLFQSLGVIQGYEIEQTKVTEAAGLTLESENYGDDSFALESQYSLLSSNIRMRFSDALQHAWINPALDHLTNIGGDVTATIDVLEHASGKIMLYLDGSPKLFCGKYNELAPMAKSLVWELAVDAHDFLLDIHAGVVGNGEYCFLMPAASGSGKSTLTAALVHSGFEYFSDEVALLHEGNLWVEAVPLANCIKDTGVEIASRYYPQLADLKLHHRVDGKHVRYVSPPMDSTPPPGTSRPVGAIIFPQYLPGKVTTLKPISKIKAMVQLEQQCLIIGVHLDKGKVADYLKWIERTPCFQLITTDLDKAVELCRALSTSLEVD